MGEFLAQVVVEVDLGTPYIVAPDVGTSAALFAAAAHPDRFAGVIVGTVVGAVASLIAMIVIGIVLASEPRLYDRGIAWMLPLRARTSFYRIAEHAGFTLRRLLFGRLVAMIFEGVFTWFMLMLGGVPMAGLLGLVTGVLAFIPNIGAIVSGVLMIAVGFSASANQGIWCIVVYFLVHNIDAYVVVPYVARRTVDLAPAVLLAMQLLMGALFGILGVLFADPILATLKVVLIDLSHQQAAKEDEGAALIGGELTSGLPAAAASVAFAAAASSARRAGAEAAAPRARRRPERPSAPEPRR
jgi:predicted PurR-regulated permease PerM